jgi:hypothetical protein
VQPRILIAALACLVCTAAQKPNVILERSGPYGGPISIPASRSGKPLTVFVSGTGDARIRLLSGDRVWVAKKLHRGDRDLFSTVRSAPDLRLVVDQHSGGRLSVRVTEWTDAPVELEPNDTQADATAVELGTTVLASGDDVEYIPSEPVRKKILDQGVDWYRFEFKAAAPKLVYFWIDLMERDNIPVDVSVYREGREYKDGADPVTEPHEVQALAGNKFTTRLLREPGTYHIRVVANHPEYKLRTKSYDPPPYTDPQQAVRTALDYILGAGDSWHANTPRRGGIYDRVSSVHQETSLCVACHATHFPQRAALYAARNGYPVEMKEQLEFLTERFYNNPRPFYGFESEGAVWARVISAPANVLGRMSHLMDVYEREISGERREQFHKGIAKYLDLYYRDRTKLPADETNGNTPLVSAYEVAWYAWEVTKDPKIAALIEQDAVKNMVDLCYQTLALAAIDRQKHAGKLKANADRILLLQRPSGQWSMKFEPNEPEVEFQTGHAIWALHAAGIPSSHPQVRKSLDYLLARQQTFGGWFDPKQSFENFKTPFRETQMSVLALSSYFPRERGTRPSRDPAVLHDARAAAQSPDVLTRRQAVETLGRIADPADLKLLTDRLGDESKLVQRAAAWGVRQIYSRHPETAPTSLVAALNSPSERVRWGATRVFATHFAALASRREFADALIKASQQAPVPVQMQAIKGLWQFWFWTPSDAIRDSIENRLLAALDSKADPQIRLNVHEAIYNIADENIRYLYNNWVPLLSRQEDRDRAIQGRLAIEDRLATKFAKVLDTPSADELLTALTRLTLRRSDVYDPNADLNAPAPPAVYNRIGNDIEQIAFFGPANARLARALQKHLDSGHPLAVEASLMVRDARFATVSKLAGDPGEDTQKLIGKVVAMNPSNDALKALGRGNAPKPAAAAAAAKPAAPAKPDEGYFNGLVRPILEAKGKDGYACVQCHATHTLFNGSYTSALNVIDPANPESSMLLRKPTSDAAAEGIVNAKSHGGGVRWEVGSPEYNTILNWIRGAKP